MIGKVFTLGVLYFVQGLPYGFQDKFIPMYLRTSGLSHTRLSLMKLLLLPWLCKAGFAPLIDLFWTKWLWLMFSLGALTVISVLGMFLNPQYFILMSIWLLLLNLFSAFQDVSVDALAMHILQESEMGHGSTAQVVGYKLGALFGGGILYWIHYYQGWTYLCLSLASLYIMSIVAFSPMFFQQLSSENDPVSGMSSSQIAESYEKEIKTSLKLKTEDEKIIKTSPILLDPYTSEGYHDNQVRHRSINKNSVAEVLSENSTSSKPVVECGNYHICEIPHLLFSTRGTIPIIVFLLVYKLGERGALSTFPLFLVDQGISTKSIGFWSGICGQLCSLFGSVCGGFFIARKWNVSRILFYSLLLRSGPIFVQYVIVNMWYHGLPNILHSILFFSSVCSLCLLEFAAGLGTTATFTLMMSCALRAPPAFQATYYSVLASVEVSGKLLFSSLAGSLIDLMGISWVYFLFLALSTTSAFLVRFIEVA